MEKQQTTITEFYDPKNKLAPEIVKGAVEFDPRAKWWDQPYEVQNAEIKKLMDTHK